MNYLIQRKNGNPSFCLVKRKPNFIFHSELDNMLKPWWKKLFGHSNTCQPKLTISDESWAFIISALKSLTLKHLKNSCTEIETLPKQKKKKTKFEMIKLSFIYVKPISCKLWKDCVHYIANKRPICLNSFLSST